METGYLYFITDEFYEKFDKDKTLMQNKESINGQTHDRPCFFAVRDTKDEEIYWLVPLSSKVEKYEAIVQQKIEKMKSKGKENPECNTIRFGKVMGNQTVFLIQNMFPSTNKYINNIYVDRNTHNNVTLSPDVTKDIILYGKIEESKGAREMEQTSFSDFEYSNRKNGNETGRISGDHG